MFLYINQNFNNYISLLSALDYLIYAVLNEAKALEQLWYITRIKI